jgi:hypothetical protein
MAWLSASHSASSSLRPLEVSGCAVAKMIVNEIDDDDNDEDDDDIPDKERYRLHSHQAEKNWRIINQI